MTSLEQAGVATLGEHFQLKIEVITENGKSETFYIYLREIDKAIKCKPYYAKVFKVKDQVETSDFGVTKP
jgi:hypothetical protein